MIVLPGGFSDYDISRTPAAWGLSRVANYEHFEPGIAICHLALSL